MQSENGALLITSTHKNDDSKSLIIVDCLVPVQIATTMIKVLVLVWIYNIFLTSNNNSNIHNILTYKCDNDSNNGISRNSMNKNKNTRKSNRNSNRNRNSSNNNSHHDSSTNRSIKPSTSKKNEGSNSTVSIVLLAALVLVLVRTTIICHELNIDTNHNNKNSYCSTTTIATINTNTSNYGNSTGSHNRISTHTKIYKKRVSNSSNNSLVLAMMIIMV